MSDITIDRSDKGFTDQLEIMMFELKTRLKKKPVPGQPYSVKIVCGDTNVSFTRVPSLNKKTETVKKKKGKKK